MKSPEEGVIGIQEIHRRLRLLGDPKRAEAMRGYFKTGPGEYGEGDMFVGVSVPVTRGLAKRYEALPLQESVSLLQSPIHEARLLALLILCRAYIRGHASLREEIFRLYVKNTRFINNWDLVDLSAQHIVGAHLADGDRALLDTLARSDLIWDRRIAIMATFHYIKNGEFSQTIEIAHQLLKDREDLIHKAVGWMLREIGKRDRRAEETFLNAHYKKMPRTMLRYAIERFPEELRQKYLKGMV